LANWHLRHRGQKEPRAGTPGRGAPETTSFASTSVVKAAWSSAQPSHGAQILGGGLAGPAVGDDLEGDLLPFVEGAHAGAFNGADMNEDVLAAGVRLNEAEALLVVEPLHGSDIHANHFLWIAVR